MIIIVGVILRFLTPQNIATTSPTGYSLNQVTPGRTTLDQLIKALGQPQSSQQVATGTLYNFPSEQRHTADEVIAQNNRVVFYKKKLPSSTTNDYLPSKLQSTLQETPLRLYGPDSGAGYYLYVFLDHGLAVYASEQDHFVLELWTFIPTNRDTFLSSWATNYSTTFRPEPFNPISNPTIPPVPTLAP
ncbi:MAG: hypothetical protein ACD_40C00140G0002 [uncultured bacterium]|nr:MAG: hypothetical protein ACD_40C00140G0002 [uncultured bacterium]